MYNMSKVFCKPKYKLEVHWDDITYQNDKIALLNNAYFSGPVLKSAEKINPKDFIDLDLTNQLIHVLDTYYIIRLSWQDVNYKDDKVELITATLGNIDLKEFHKIVKEDYFIIDTEKHEERLHAFNLLYKCKLMRSDSSLVYYEDK